jgi:predicted ATPase/DNA-binding CsgD family transcriptional regulator
MAALSPSLPDRPPVPRTRLIGREAEREIARSLLLDEAVPLLTLTGPGGVGKTRLALAVSGDVGKHFADGVVWVDLAPVADPTLVTLAVARSLGLRDGAEGQEASLTAVLASRQLLLLLDNCEHLGAATADLVANLLAACPTLQVLATSRAPLRIRDEHTLPVAPLPVPPDDARSPERVVAAAAGALFVERAQAANATFSLNADNAASVAAVVRCLDGLPLAIELAAARTRYLSPPALRALLADRLRLLSGGARDLPSRQRTMRDAIAWSYDLLTPAEQALFHRLAVFVGFSLEAAEWVGGRESGVGGTRTQGDTTSDLRPPTSDSPSVLDLLASLLDSSMLRPVPGTDDAPRYALLETIREFGVEHLIAEGEEEATRRAHAAYYLALAESARPALMGAEQGFWLERLEIEHDNLRVALNWLSAAGETEASLRLAATLWRFWQMHGHWSEGRSWLKRTLAGNTAPSSWARAEALLGAGALAHLQGDHEQAAVTLQEALRCFRTFQDERGLVETLTEMGNAASNRADHDQAISAYEGALALCRRLDDQVGIADALHNLGNVAYDRGERDRAKDLWEQSLALEQVLGRANGIAISLLNLGIVAQERGNGAQATTLLTEALTLFAELGVQEGIAWCFDGLGRVLAPLRPDLATRWLAAADAVRTAIDAPIPDHRRPAHDCAVATARASLGDTAFAAAWAEGGALPLAQAIAKALAVGASVPMPSVLTTRSNDAAIERLGLTTREQEILRLLVEGRTNPEIAAALFISHKTVRAHVTSILGKLGAETRTAAATYAVRHGFA